MFTQTLYYNDQYGGSAKRYNGNIGAISWLVSGDKTRGYSFAYDNLSRLTTANYLENGAVPVNSTFPNQAPSYKTTYTYDKHGNMKTLQRYGKNSTGLTFGLVDNLTMTHTGNQQLAVNDAIATISATESADFKNYTNTTTEYLYNANGAMSQDLNKGISNIQYNSLNLPLLMDIKSPVGEARNEYTYTASGAKLKVVQKWNSNYSSAPAVGSAINLSALNMSKTTDYVGNKIYEQGSLKRILIDGGYIEGGVYYFYLTDHLGNNRVVANASGTVIQKNHYYPFGMTFAETPKAEQDKQPYKYNGKELDQMHGLNMYDYSARYYEPAVGRFTTVDPLAEKYYSISPYVYCANNPINAIDPRGDSIWYTIDNNIATMHFTAKVINKSSNNINVNKLAKSIASGISKAVGNEIAIDGTTYELQTNIQIEGVSSMDDVSSSDHLFAITDHFDYTKYGVTNEIGGKVIHLNESAVDGYFSYNTRSAVHEFGHTLGLVHTDPSSLGYNSATDIMTQGGEGTKFTGGNMINAYENSKAGKLNKGVNSIKTSDGRRIPYPVVKYGNQIGTVFQLGFRYNYK